MKILHIEIKDCQMCPYKTEYYNIDGWVDHCNRASTTWIYNDKIPDWCPLPEIWKPEEK